MSKRLYCPHCGAYVGDCGHVPGGFSGPSTLQGTCGKCEREYSVTCNGDCLNNKSDESAEGFKIKIFIGEDGKSIVDSEGNEIARFSENITIRITTKEGERKIPGHLICRKECIAWDSNGVCIKYIQSCTWEFPPFDF
ncbi:MAG: hypothetical protein PHV06_03215 [bacterium]|nr:hypothetical protein [bacterium]